MKSKEPRIVLSHKDNFNTLAQAFRNDDVLLMDCIDKTTKEHVAVICAVQPAHDQSGEVETVPFARFFNGNPYDMLYSPLDPEYDKIVAEEKANAKHS